jgi:hypothetical protein
MVIPMVPGHMSKLTIGTDMPYWVLAEGRGTALTAHVVGPYTSLQAMQQANPGFAGETVSVVGNESGYPNQLAAQQEANTYNHSDVNTRVTQAGGNTAQSLGIDPVSGIEDLFHGLNLGNILLRIGEVLLGIVLVGVGLAKITGTTNFVASALKTKVPI